MLYVSHTTVPPDGNQTDQRGVTLLSGEHPGASHGGSGHANSIVLVERTGFLHALRLRVRNFGRGSASHRQPDVNAPCASGAVGEPSPIPTATRSTSGIRVSVPSQCGVRGVWVDGELWLAAPPLGGHNPPPGWDENATVGSFVRTAQRRGVFHGDGGQQAVFHLAEAGTADPNAGCE